MKLDCYNTKNLEDPKNIKKEKIEQYSLSLNTPKTDKDRQILLEAID